MSSRHLLLATAAVVLLALASAPLTQAASATLPPPPAGWPATLQLGLADGAGGAAATRAKFRTGLRYQYLAGGVNTGRSWSTWNPGGAFVSNYVRESLKARTTPVFSYYMLRHSAPGARDRDEARADLRNLREPATMKAWYEDLALAFARAGRFKPAKVVFQIEPDLWAYIQQASRDDDAATVPAAVASTGLPALAGLPDTAAGFAQAIVRLRDRNAPNVQLAYHLSDWGTRTDLHLNRPNGRQVDALAARAAAFERSLGARFQLLFTDWADADAGFEQKIRGDGGASWWAPEDFRRATRFLAGVVRGTGLRAVVWQLPLGNTVMRAMDDTWGHFRDNRVQTLLDDSRQRVLRQLARAGVIGLLFGGGAEGTTCACDWRRDGVTNPPQVFGRTRDSLTADDDGGFFRQLARRYARDPLPLPR
ncbi:hypothetical protein [Conexibacter woesei]|uniref:GH26 domain-containing protein n=1 Tax=Conexibacter woesei (strain DSM 14684 / CCUG 47730 / CIP 108061 / JCM 11494 / NBRC 100937 / ID131577) TaxID=469383 RepID=D3EZ54_CONWI|nr:hypothetical protein [Conexibacter woesei]ADB51819.1 hypothetical protein Cwoe_3401 [Conexibacter woesei DSM 14684]